MKTADDKKKRLSNEASVAVNECSGRRRCGKCVWSVKNGGYCPGCDTDYQERCLKRKCVLACSICSGGKHARVPGCCGRAPASWRKEWNRLLEHRVPDYAPDPLPIKCRLIPVIYAQVKRYKIPEKFPQIDAWVVPIHKAADRQGKFRSKDLKDYLGLPPDRKLILSTCAPDDFEEMLWKKGSEMNYKQHGIDYWFPAHFSVYDDDSKLYQFASAKRQQLHAVWTESQFVWFRLGEHIPIEFLAPIRNAPSVLISTSQMFSKRNRAIVHKEVESADRWFPKKTAFFVVGGSKGLPITSGRALFEINSNWLMRALWGRNLTHRGQSKLSRGRLLTKNLREVLESVDPGANQRTGRKGGGRSGEGDGRRVR